MNIALIGATGFVGTPLLEELLNRGHSVTVLARDPAKLAPRERLRVTRADALDSAQVAQALEGQQALVSAYNPGWTHPELYERSLAGHRAIVAAARQAKIARLLV